MANELTLTGKLTYSKDSTSLSLDAGTIQVTVAGNAAIHHRQSVGTSEEALVLGDVTTVGYILIVNRDATNFVEVRPGTGAADLVRLDADGGFALFKLATTATAPYVIADTAACEIEYIVVES